MQKQRDRVLNQMQMLRIAVDISDKSLKVVPQKPIQAIGGGGICLADEMFCWGDNFVGMRIV